MNRPALHVHIGTHKTASTSIQSLLLGAEEELARSDIRVAEAGRNPAGAHHHLAWDAWNDARFDAAVGGMADLEEEIDAHPAQSFVISAESFSARPGDRRALDLLRGVEHRRQVRLRAIGYVRPQWRYLDSLYVQQVKMGFHGETFETFVEKQIDAPRFDYNAVFSTWAELGEELAVRPFERAQLPDGVLADFCGWLGVRLDAIDDTPRMNERVGITQLEVLRLATVEMTRLGVPKLERQRTARRLRTALEPVLPDDPPFSGLDRPTAVAIADRFRESNTEAASRFGVAQPGLFVEDAARATYAPQRLSWAELEEPVARRLRDVVARESGVEIPLPSGETLR